MNYAKVDAALAAALAAPDQRDVVDSPRLAVFVQLAEGVAPAEREALAGLGLVSVPPGEATTCTATLTPAQVAALSDQPSVRRLQLSGRLRLRPSL